MRLCGRILHRFGVHSSAVSWTFVHVIDVLYSKLKPLIIWSDRDNSIMPMEHCPKCVVIIEIFLNDLLIYWPKLKHIHHTNQYSLREHIPFGITKYGHCHRIPDTHSWFSYPKEWHNMQAWFPKSHHTITVSWNCFTIIFSNNPRSKGLIDSSDLPANYHMCVVTN